MYISDLQYFSPVIFYKISFKYSHVLFDQYEFYQKTGFGNRCYIAGAEGRITLTVPLEKGRNQKTVFKDVKIDRKTDWQLIHFRSLESCYNRSPWFEYYRQELEKLYRSKFVFLVDWNMACFSWLAQKTGLQQSWSLNDHRLELQEESGDLDARNTLTIKNYSIFNIPAYNQVFRERTGFLNNLSILDLLFCEGSATAEYLQRE